MFRPKRSGNVAFLMLFWFEKDRELCPMSLSASVLMERNTQESQHVLSWNNGWWKYSESSLARLGSGEAV